MPYLIARTSDGQRHEFTLDRPMMVLGRAPKCDLPLPDEKNLSRRHLTLECIDGVIWAEDLGSINGTRYRGKPITRRMILEGDVLRVGELRLEFTYHDPATRGVTASAEHVPVSAAPAPGADASGSGSAEITDVVNTMARPPQNAGAADDDGATPPAGTPAVADVAPAPPPVVVPPPPRRVEPAPPRIPPPSSPPPQRAGAGSVPPPRPDEMIGQVLAGYTIEERIGRGGMGSVYRARHNVMDTVVAIKMVRGEVDDENRARFFREARAAFGLAHPNIVRVLHADMTDDGRPFLVMEFVDGVSMRQYVPEGGMPDDVVARLLVQIAAGLAAAHAAGLVHRDIKPDNLLVEAGSLRPRITDFGLTRAVDADSEITRTGLYGTPAFMPPEQWDNSATVDHRADIYALGVTAYYMLTRQLPYPGKDAVTVMQHMLKRNRIPLTQLAPDVDPGLADIIDAMMEWEADRRYQTVTDLQADLSDWLRASSGGGRR